uniref:GYF domain-containing protein n=1 Tax=Tanacetum cinerariifolium TaxID=118510 RepID=A0A699HSS0_TANCI|nr:hypothetical protein [Tanacetum cinerariifolium]
MLTIVITSSETKIAAKRSKSGHWFGFVRFKNVNDINLLEERSGDSKPNEGMNTQPIRDNANVFQSFNSYAKAVLGNKSMGVSGNNDASNSGEKPVGVSVSNKANKESSNEALIFISEDDCIDLDGMERSILVKVKDLSVITDLLKYMSSEGFVDVGLRYVGGRWVWLEFDSTDQMESVKNSKVLNELFLELKDVSYNFIPDERCVWIDLVGLSLASWAPEVYKKLGGRWGCSVFTDMVNDGPLSHGKVCVLTESLHRVLESFKVLYHNRSYCTTATEFAYWASNIESTEDKSMTDSLKRKDDEGPSLDGGPEHEEALDLLREVDVRGVDNDHVDSFEEGEIIGDSVLNNDGCVKDCEILEDHFDGDHRNDTIEDNVDVNPSTNVYLDVNQNNSIPEIVEDLSPLDKSSDKAERLAHHNNGLDDLDISLCNRLLHQDKCRVRPVKAAINDSSIVSPSTPPGTVLNLAEESCSTWLDYVGPIITDELDFKKRWSYRDPDGNVQGSFSLAQLRMWKDYFPSDLKIWSYYGNVKEAILIHNALKRRTKDNG